MRANGSVMAQTIGIKEMNDTPYLLYASLEDLTGEKDSTLQFTDF